MVNRPSSEENSSLADANRVEAFSDGVFAIVATILVLEIHRPAGASGELAQELLENWPAYLSYVLAFLYVGIIWLNHHNLFQLIGKVDLTLNCANLAGLGMTVLLPFPTGVMADAFRLGNFADERAAVTLYAVVAALMSLAWLPLFIYLGRHPELMKPHAKAETFAYEVSRPIVGILSYALAAVLGWFVHPLLAVALFVFMVLYHAWTCQGIRSRRHAN
jgi:uncharacterized membrane protein